MKKIKLDLVKKREDQISKIEPRWFAVYTRYKAEKFIVERLQKKDIECYVPLLKYTKKYQRKIKHVEVPLISCYVFVKIVKEDYVRVLETEHVINFLKIRGVLISIPNEEIEVLKWVVGEDLVENVTSETFEKGSKVEVIAGNLTGLKGEIVKRKSKKIFIVELENIGYTLEVNIAQELLQAIKTNVVSSQ